MSTLEPVVVRRNTWLSAAVATAAALLAVAFLVRGADGWDTALGALMIVVAAAQLPALVAARMPVAVADRHGIRLRVGLAWRGLPWSGIDGHDVERPAWWQERRLVVVPRDTAALRADTGLLGRLHLAWNRFWYAADLAVPLGLTTHTDSDDLADDLAALADDRRGGAPPRVERRAGELPPPPEPLLPEPVAPLREPPTAVRADVVPEAVSPRPSPEQAHEQVGVVAPADIGARIRRARELLDMDVDELSSRTHIRPHVIEAMEVDDFGPCGGDVYARGHLTAVARTLGLDVEPLLTVYDDRHAQGPINARRVFEAELASGVPAGGLRATLSGPRWSLLIGTVLCLTTIWGMARLVAGDPEQLAAPPARSDTAGLAANHEPITSPLMTTRKIRVTAAHAPAHVVVRDRTGRVLWSGDLAQGKHRTIAGAAPFSVTTDNAGALEVRYRGKDKGTLGPAGAERTRSYG